MSPKKKPKKKVEKEPIKIQVYPSTTAKACLFYRMYSPLSMLDELKKGELDYNINPNPTAAMIDNAEIVVFQRAGFPQDLELLRGVLAKGKRVVYEVDDDLLHIPPQNPHHKHYSQKVIQDTIKHFVSNAHAVTVPTMPLQDILSQYNDNVILIPNAMDFRMIQPRARNNKRIVVGYQGAIEHQKEFNIVRKCLDTLAKEFKDKVLVRLFGYSHPRCETVKYFPFEYFHAALRMADFDIGLAPLAKNQFNECKSNLKWLEYGAFETATIATDIFPYGETIEHGVDGFLVESPKDWVEIISMLVDDPVKLEEVQRAAHHAVGDEFNVKDMCMVWYTLFNDLKRGKYDRKS